jgi:hypothetical protein
MSPRRSTRDHQRTDTAHADQVRGRAPAGVADRLTGGLVGILCCVGPTVPALLDMVSAGTAFAWSTDLYDNHAWWFRLGGLVVLATLVWVSLRRRGQCSIAGVRRWRLRLVGVVGVTVATYGVP